MCQHGGDLCKGMCMVCVGGIGCSLRNVSTLVLDVWKWQCVSVGVGFLCWSKCAGTKWRKSQQLEMLDLTQLTHSKHCSK